MIDTTCPWCGAQAVSRNRGITYAYACACGAWALGAPPYDFDEVIDDAISLFGLRADATNVNFVPPERWLDELGVAFQPAVPTALGSALRFYWFKRVAAPRAPDPAVQADLDRIWELSGRAFSTPADAPAITAELQTLRDRALAANRPTVADAATNALRLLTELTGKG